MNKKIVANITAESPNKWVRDVAIDQPSSLTSAQKTAYSTNGFRPCSNQ
ncbi:hypothetical protein [Larkinella ripae]